uniref:C6 domain-containing protein n=1 Tax=Elaeophora elaphi TaxID=1147741 RepID=A0A0R3RNR7_9BILA
PCSTCGPINAVNVKNPEINEGNGKLAIEYGFNDFGCRIATLVCSVSDTDNEAVIYFNEMKDTPAVTSMNGVAMIAVTCSENTRFKIQASRTNIENVTCLSRDVTPPPSPPPTTVPPTTQPPSTAKPTPPPCTTCPNLKTAEIITLEPNEMNGPLTIEYFKQADGCRTANIICGVVKEATIARIHFNENMLLPFLSDLTGEARLELICGDNSEWRAFQSTINVANISCLVIGKLMIFDGAK